MVGTFLNQVGKSVLFVYGGNMNLTEFATRVDVAALGYGIAWSDTLLNDPLVVRACLHESHILQSRKAGKLTSCVICFPFGYGDPGQEISSAILKGAQEVDIALPIDRLSFGQDVGPWIKSLGLNQFDPDITYKIIIHTDLLGSIYGEKGILDRVVDQIRKGFSQMDLSKLILKTCTGYGPGGAEPETVRKLRSLGYRVKASGGIKTWARANELFDAGAELLGMSYKNFKQIIEEHFKDGRK